MTPNDFRAWRKSRWRTQAACATFLDIPSRRIWSYETGELPIPRHVILSMVAIEAGLAPEFPKPRKKKE